MNFIRKNYWIVSALACLLTGILFFFMSYRSYRKDLVSQTEHTIEVVTNVKQQLLERKLYSLEQQLDLLSKDEIVNQLLTSAAEKNQPSKERPQFEEYIKSLLYNQGFTSLLVIHQSGEIVYASNSNLDKTAVPAELLRFAQKSEGAQDSTGISKVILSKKEPFQFYVSERVTDTKGIFHGAIFIEIPREFLSIELHNTIALDSLKSYLTSSQGNMDQLGRMLPDPCVDCPWGSDKFLVFAPTKKIGGTWTLSSAYPIDQVKVQHILYVSALDGMIAFFATGIVVLVVLYAMQLAQRKKGITHSDILLVQTTWNAVSEFSSKIIQGFYKHLFAAAPEVKPMFKSEKVEQEKRMGLMINTIVNSADSLEEFRGSISQLAKKHVHMGVRKEYFPIVVKAIISSVEDQYGSGFTAAHKKAWYKILNQISNIMIEEMEAFQRSSREALDETVASHQ